MIDLNTCDQKLLPAMAGRRAVKYHQPDDGWRVEEPTDA